MPKMMHQTRKAKIALMAAASVLAGAAALAPAHANEIDPVANPTMIEAPISAIDQSVDHGDEQKSFIAGKWPWLVAAAAALAGLVRLIGAGKIARAAGKTVKQAAKVSIKAAAGAGRVLSRSFGSPLRFAAVIAGLGLFSLTGLWLFDIEWIGGFAAGAALAGVMIYGGLRTRAVWRRVNPLKSKAEVMVNGN